MGPSISGDPFELVTFDENEVRIFRDEFNRLSLKLGATVLYEDITPVRAFPLTRPDSFIFFLDTEGKQIGGIQSVPALEPESREVLSEELEARYFTTQVRAILGAKSSHGITTWELDTNRGRREIHVRDRNDIRRLPGRRVIMTDAHGMRYEIADTGRLDERSLMFFEAES